MCQVFYLPNIYIFLAHPEETAHRQSTTGRLKGQSIALTFTATSREDSDLHVFGRNGRKQRLGSKHGPPLSHVECVCSLLRTEIMITVCETDACGATCKVGLLIPANGFSLHAGRSEVRNQGQQTPVWELVFLYTTKDCFGKTNFTASFFLTLHLPSSPH